MDGRFFEALFWILKELHNSHIHEIIFAAHCLRALFWILKEIHISHIRDVIFAADGHCPMLHYI
jgi:hypothetical protein